MAGLINTAIKQPWQDSNSFVGYDPEKIAVDPKSTVQGQVADIIKSGSQLNQLAESKAKSAANRRGLVNSAMAVGAGQKAVIESALPIAQQDASTNFNAQLSNQNAGNQASQFTADATNKAADIVARTVAEKDLSAQRATQDYNLQILRGNQQRESDQTAAQTSRLNTASSSASLIYAQSQQAIQAILADKDMTPEIKQQQIDKMREMQDQQVSLIAKFHDIDVADLLNFTTAAPTPASAQTPAAQQPSSADALSSQFASINANSRTEEDAARAMLAAGRAQGATIEQMAAAAGLTAQQANAILAKYNLA